jgi:hypothetical protein
MSLAVGGPFDPGDQVVITATLADLDGDPASPSAYTWKVKAPGVTEASYTQASPECDDPETGSCTLTIETTNHPGTWYVSITGTAGLICADEGRFTVSKWVTTPP